MTTRQNHRLESTVYNSCVSCV